MVPEAGNNAHVNCFKDVSILVVLEVVPEDQEKALKKSLEEVSILVVLEVVPEAKILKCFAAVL